MTLFDTFKITLNTKIKKAACLSAISILIASTITIQAFATGKITGNLNVCTGLTTALSDTTAGGTWSSSNTAVAVADSVTGIVSGLAAGTAVISYTAGGVSSVATVTVHPLPAAIAGALTVCTAATTALTDAGGGTWSISSTAVAIIGRTGIVTGKTTGTAIVTYKLSTGCITTDTITVNASPSAILGSLNICDGLTTSLSDTTDIGTWSSSNTAIAIADSTGLVTGISVGTASITYTIGNGCGTAKTVIVHALPSAITGTPIVCATGTTALSDAGGGTWSINNSAIATVATTGIVTGKLAGVAIVTYKLSTGCITTDTITVNASPSAILGSLNICDGLTTSLSDTTDVGVWSSSNTAIAVADSTGLVTGVSVGSASITYTIGNGCGTAKTVTVHALPSAIAGTPIVCATATTALSDAGGGTWSINNTAIATIATNGIVTGKSAGTAIVTYKLSTGCIATDTVTVNASPSTILGSTSACDGLTTSLSDTTDVGVWSSSNTAVAAVDSAGLVTGISLGTASITYIIGSGCGTAKTITVHALPSAITGTPIVCAAATTALSDAGGGAWSISNTTIATVGKTGIVTGKAEGIAIVTYKLSTGCIATDTVTVNASPSAILGATSVCDGLTTSLSDTTDVGVWSSSNTAIAVVDSTGLAMGVSVGAANITYTIGSGCRTIKAITVQALPPAIAGMSVVCAGTTATLSDSGGGAWSVNNSSVATIASSGVITGKSPGTAMVTYKLRTGCIATKTMTVNLSPSVIIGTLNVCDGMTTSLSDTTSVGSWSCSNTVIATITNTGVVTGESAGTANITYTIGSGCRTLKTVTVHVLPPAITGTPSVCTAATTALSDAAVGTWSISNTTIATIASTGIVTGKAAGTATVTYKISAGCAAMDTITIISSPSAIAGPTGICTGSSATLTDAEAGGVWSSSNSAAATIDSDGTVTSVSAGTTTITYAVGTGCSTQKILTVSGVPSVITAPATICVLSGPTFYDSTDGGIWSSSNTAVATVGRDNGIVTGISSGTVNIDYQLGTGCAATATVTVYPMPSPIYGSGSVCVGSAATLSNAATDGFWSSSNPAVASVDSFSGVETGIAAGTAAITFTLSTGCGVSFKKSVVYPVPSVIAGTDSICEGLAITLSDATVKGVWASSNTTVAVVGRSTGIVSGIALGTTNISYTVATGCRSLKTITVYDCGSHKAIFDSALSPEEKGAGPLTPVALNVYPNPNNGNFTLLLSSVTDEPAMMTLSNVVGQKIMELPMTANQAVQVTTGPVQPAGVYLITVVTAGGRYMTKVIVNK
jgi:trimeric autotransporter adhesin